METLVVVLDQSISELEFQLRVIILLRMAVQAIKLAILRRHYAQQPIAVIDIRNMVYI